MFFASHIASHPNRLRRGSGMLSMMLPASSPMRRNHSAYMRFSILDGMSSLWTELREDAKQLRKVLRALPDVD
jgi:hypothetical protein